MQKRRRGYDVGDSQLYSNIAHGGYGGLGNGYGGYNAARGQFGRYTGAGGLADIGNEDYTRRRYLGGGGVNNGFDYYGDYPEYSDYTSFGGGGNYKQQFAPGQLGLGQGQNYGVRGQVQNYGVGGQGQQYGAGVGQGQQHGVGGQVTQYGAGPQGLGQGRFLSNAGGGYRNMIAGGFNAGNRGFGGLGYGSGSGNLGAGGFNAQNIGYGQTQFG